MTPNDSTTKKTKDEIKITNPLDKGGSLGIIVNPNIKTDLFYYENVFAHQKNVSITNKNLYNLQALLKSKPDPNDKTNFEINQETPQSAELLDLNKKLNTGKLTKNKPVNKYYIMHTIGEGNFATVKMARHVMTGETVAIKVIKIDDMSEDLKKKLVREVNIMKKCNHMNIMKILEVIIKPSYVYLVSEFAHGGELYAYLMHNGYLHENEAKLMFQQILSAVEYCHNHKIVHRDLKSENILLDGSFNVRLTDFGFAALYQTDQKLSTFCGSPLYAAPELLMGNTYLGPPVDIWSLGVILFNIVSGRLPFDGDSFLELKMKVLNLRFITPYYLSNQCAKLLKNILVINPQDRPTISKIKTYKWFDETSRKEFKLVQREVFKVNKEETIKLRKSRIDKLVDEGYTIEEIIDSVDNRRFNYIYASYHLINEENLKHPNIQTQALDAEKNTQLLVTKTAGPHSMRAYAKKAQNQSSENPKVINKFIVSTVPQSEPVPKEECKVADILKLEEHQQVPQTNTWSLSSFTKNNVLAKTLRKIKFSNTESEDICTVGTAGNTLDEYNQVSKPDKTEFLEVLSRSHSPFNNDTRAQMFLQQTISQQKKMNPDNEKTKVDKQITADSTRNIMANYEPSNEGGHDISNVIKKFFFRESKYEKEASDDYSHEFKAPVKDRSLRTILFKDSTKTSDLTYEEKLAKIKPRLNRFTISVKTLSTKNPDDIIEGLRRILTNRNIKFSQVEKYLLLCCDYNIQWEFEVCRLGFMNLHGIRMDRIFGNKLTYNKIITEILKELEL